MTPPLGYNLIWNDEFSGITLDSSKWLNPADSQCSPRNSEGEIYMPDDVYLDGNGHLVLRSQKRTIGGCNYSSGAVSTRGRFTISQGYVEIRAQLPQGGKGIWPGLWLYPPTQWPPELDILECVIDMANIWMSYRGTSSTPDISHPYTDPAFRTGFHTYAAEWKTGIVNWYIDDILRQTWSGTDVITNIPMMIYMSTAVGGPDPNWPGWPDSSTVFPQYMYVDYVRVYQYSSTPLNVSLSINPSTVYLGQPTTITATVS